ncbi:MAG TPA: metal-dependent hydrolase [Candidatus Methanoperedens sp.]
MDFFSHALLPYLLGNFFRRKKQHVTAFVLGGIAPDIDVFIMWINFVYPTFFLVTHRGLTHSLFFGFFTGFAVLYLASRAGIKNRLQRFFGLDAVVTPGAVLFAYAGVVLHLVLDYVTTRGVPLLFPFEVTRYSAEVFFYTDIYLTILSVIIIIALYKKLWQKNAVTGFLILFLVAFALLGTVRMVEKTSAGDSIQGNDINTYPTMNPFDWYILADDGENIKIYEYNGFSRTLPYNETTLKLYVAPGSENPDPGTALAIAGELPQVKMFKWRAYDVAINASFNDEKWLLQYYDPLQRAMIRDSPSVFRRINSPLNVTVEGERAFLS